MFRYLRNEKGSMKMNIGIDIDDTISETFETLLPYAQKYTIED